MRAPKITIPKTITVPLFDELPLANGSKLCRIAAGGQGVTRISFCFGAGSSHQTTPFSAAAVVNLMSCGTEHLTADQVAERLDFLGAFFDASIDRDYSVLTFCSLARHTSELLAIAAEVILRPTFPEQEVATYREKRKNSLRNDRMRPDFMARELFGRTLFGATHPYGSSSDERLYDNLTREILIDFYRTCYTAPNSFTVISGDSDDAAVAAVEAILSALPPTAAPKVVMPEPVSLPRGEISLPSAAQSSIRAGLVMFPRSHPDFIAMQVAATVLGGYFGSRLMKNLREKRGYTYGAYAAMINLEHSGYFVAGAEVGIEHRTEAADRILSEIDRLCRRGISKGELELVRRMLFGEVMRILDGPFGIADITIENIQNGTDNSYTSHFVEQIRSITPDEVRAAARRNLSGREFTLTIVG